MQIHFGPELMAAEWPSSVVCIGTFDGVHLGHQAVIAEAKSRAKAAGVPLVLATFDRHPAATLRPESAPPEVGSLAQNLREFARQGVDIALILTFDELLAQTEAQSFFDSILVERLRASCVVVGHDFAFGRGRTGSYAWLCERIDTVQVPPFELDGKRVSSSNIRSAIASGDFAVANRLLGRAWAMEGVVVRGEQVGRTLGYPTANLARSRGQVLPAMGIYAGHCLTPWGRFGAAISVGKRPTFGEHRLTVEAFLMDYPGESLYGSAVELEFAAKIRDEVKFDSVEALVAQMDRDVAAIRGLISGSASASGLR